MNRVEINKLKQDGYKHWVRLFFGISLAFLVMFITSGCSSLMPSAEQREINGQYMQAFAQGYNRPQAQSQSTSCNSTPNGLGGFRTTCY